MAHSHKLVILKCCIESYDESENDNTKKIKLPSISDWDKNLKSVLTRIPKKFAIVAQMDTIDWNIQIGDTLIDKTNPQQFQNVLSTTAPPAQIQIVENIRDYVLICNLDTKILKYNIHKWDQQTFNELMVLIRQHYDIEHDFSISSDIIPHHNVIDSIDALKAAFDDEYQLNVYIIIPKQFKIEYASKSFIWKPSISNNKDEKEWNNDYNTLRNEICTEFKVNQDEFEIRDDIECLIGSGQDLMANYMALIKDKLGHISNMRVLFKMNEDKITFTLNWRHIIHCVKHEMWNSLSSSVCSIIDDDKNNISQKDMNQKTVNTLLHLLKIKKNGLDIEEMEYLRRLIKRARGFVPIQSAVHHKHIINDTQNISILNDLSIPILNDIFNVHRAFIFITYHFAEYALNDFMFNVNNNEFLAKDILKNVDVIKAQFDFYPSYIINDDLFEIMNYVFAISHYVHDVQCNGNDEEEFRLYSFIIPQSITSVYDDNIRFVPNIGSIDEYLMKKNVYNFCRNIIRLNNVDTVSDIKALIDRYYDINHLKEDKTTKVMLIIDRRHLNGVDNDIVYIYSFIDINRFEELFANYFFGFDFYFNFDVTKTYIRYGIGDKLRFYPEFVTSIIPRLFKQSPSLSDSAFLHKLYKHKYKHGWKLKLDDVIFAKYYKIITSCTFISVNHDRDVITDDYEEDQKDTLFFSDILYIELSKKMKHEHVELFNDYLLANDYDSDAILFDLNQDMEGKVMLESSCISNYFDIHNQHQNWVHCRDWINRFNQRRDNTLDDAICSKDTVAQFTTCPYIKYIIYALNTFKSLQFSVLNEDLNKFDVSQLSESYDHIISVHDFCQKNEEESNEIKKYLWNELGQCTDKMECKALTKHSNRKREGKKEENRERKDRNNGRKDMNNGRNEVEGNLSEMINATLNSIHSYVLHSQWQLFRLQNDSIHKGDSRFTTPITKGDDKVNIANKSKFTTPLMNMKPTESVDILIDDSDDDDKEDDQADKNSIYTIDFGTTVIEWLTYGEKPLFASFFQEIVNNKESTVDDKLFLAFKQECFIKSITNKGEYYTLIELLSLKLYTDTTSYQSALRKAFWTSTDKQIRKSFYLWALNLYKTMLYHANPLPQRKKGKPRLIYHGLNNVFIVDKSLPMYNGPISTTLDKSVALSFSDSKGLIWDIEGSYSNPWKKIKGIAVDWISQFKHEAEFLLINEYLPIKKTKNFTNDDNNKVDHLLYTLKSVSNLITNIKMFFNQIGFVYNRAFTPIIKTHSALYKATSLGPTVSILHRLCKELKLTKEFETEYAVISSPFKVYHHRNLYSIFKLKINDNIKLDNNDCFMNCKYKMIVIENPNISDQINSIKTKTTFKYNDEIKIRNNVSYKVYVRNKKLFCRSNYVLLQQIDPIQFDDAFSTAFYNNLSMQNDAVILNPYKMSEENEKEEEEYEDESDEEEEEYDVKQDIYDKMDDETKQQILNAKYVLKLSSNDFEDDINENNVKGNDVYECKDIEHFRMKLPDNNTSNTIYCYKLYVKLGKNPYYLFKTFYFTEYIFNNEDGNDILINHSINMNCVEEGGGSIQIFCKSSIVISERGMINATECGFDNLDIKYDEEEEEEEEDDEDFMVLKYGKTVRSDDDYDSVILGGGIIELISEKNIVNNGKIVSNGGSIKIFAKNDFINNGQILSKGGDIMIQCRAQNRDAKSSIEPPPKIQNMNNKMDGFTDLERVITKNEHKINIVVCDKNGAKRENTSPSNLLSSSPDTYYLSKDLHSVIESDWITFEYQDPHLITKILIQNHAQKNGIKKISLHLAKHHLTANWYEIASIDNIEMNKSEQIFNIKCGVDINQIADDKLCVLKLKILSNHGRGKSWTNRFYQFQVYGKYIYDVIPNIDED